MTTFAQNVQPNQGGAPAAPVTGQESQPASPAQPSAGSPLISLLPFFLIIPLFFMMFRRNKKEDAARASLKRGDRIVSQSGLVGELVEMDERFAKVKLGPGNTVTMLRSSLSPLDATAPAAKGDDGLKDLKDAKAAAAADEK